MLYRFVRFLLELFFVESSQFQETTSHGLCNCMCTAPKRRRPAWTLARSIAFILRRKIRSLQAKKCSISTRWSVLIAAPAYPFARCRPFLRLMTCRKNGRATLSGTQSILEDSF